MNQPTSALTIVSNIMIYTRSIASIWGHVVKVSFRQNASEYIQETEQISPVWRIWLPIAAAVILPVWAYFHFSSYRQIMQNETVGLLELSHAIFPLIASIIAIRLLFKTQLSSGPFIFLALASIAVGGVLICGEELSWGQHHFGWATPDSWSEVNNQKETNIHNTSRWLNLIPRTTFIVLIVLGGTIFPWAKINRPHWTIKRFDFLYPPRALAVFACITFLLELLVQAGDHFDLEWIVRFHDGELQELFIVSSILLYTAVLWIRYKTIEQPSGS